jgi:hypothetical protein
MLQLVDFMDLYRRKYATEEEKNASANKEAIAMAKMTGGPVAGQNL